MVKEESAAMRVSPENLAEALMCLVLTNAVEVLDEKGTNVGIAVYDWTFSWINHSCSPNACYRFTAMADDDDRDGDSRLRIYPAMVDGGGGGAATSDQKRSQGFGPRIIVRSIMGIRKDEEVTIAYTDLLQPKGLRQSELLLNHQFNCCCKRCRATPAAYVDRNLQAVYMCGPNGTELISDDDFYKTTEAQKLTDAFDEAVDEHLQLNNPENCCIKLDELLTHGYRTSQSFIRLHQFHHLSLNACTTLASAYRVRASDLMVNSASESYDMSRASAAYSLLLAVFTHHLFRAEPSLIASAANHWKIAGESLICLSRKVQASSSGTSHECYQIFRQDGFDEKYFATEMLSEVSSQLLNCIVNLAGKVWSLLTDQQVCHLNEIKNLVDFRALLMVVSLIPDDSGTEDAVLDSVHIFHLGFHCLVFGMYLSGVCFGKQSADDTIVNTFHNNGVFPGER